MSLKVKLVSAIASFCLVLALVIGSVWALTTGSITIGGTVSFQAVNVYCDVSGDVENSGKVVTFSTLKWSAGSQPLEEELNTWKGRSLEFNKQGEAFTYTITIKNRSDERIIKVNLKDVATDVDSQITKSITFDGETYDAKLAEEVEIPVSATKSFVITFAIEGSLDNTISNIPYSYKLTLTDENYDPEG